VLLEVSEILGVPDITVYIFGSRKDRTGSSRSDIDLLVPLEHRVDEFQARELWALEPYLDIFILDRGIATSLINESQIRADSDADLINLVGAQEVFVEGSWRDHSQLLRYHTVLAERSPAATCAPLYDLTDAIPAERADILVMTALTEEYHAIVDALGGFRMAPSSLVDVCDSGDSPWRVRIVNMAEMGSVGAALKTQDAIRRTKAEHVVLVGICAGIPGRAEMLDVVIPKSVLYYESKKVTGSGDQSAPETCECDDSVRNRAALGAWRSEPDDYHLKVLADGELLACGEKVVSADGFRDDIAKAHRKLAGIDMESYGVLRAARAAGRKATVIKSVCDMADEEKSDAKHTEACSAAARVLHRLIVSGAFRP
jgi:nucleoside phosphorylase/predicted nucleotidyltransferase